LLAVVAGAFGGVRRAARLTPAEAMRPPVPADFSGRLSRFAARLGPDEPSRMILRGLVRRPLRSGLAVVGISAALALYIASASATDNVERMIELIFDRSQRGDLIVSFAEPRDARAIYELERLPGVLRVEPFRAAGARLRVGHRVEREGLTSADPGADLRRLIDVDGNLVELPPTGAIVSSSLARQLGVAPGDRMKVELTEGDRSTLSITVAQVVDMPIGASATVDRARLNRLLREGETVSGAYLSVDDAQLPRLYAELKVTPAVANVTIFTAMLQSLRQTIGESMGLVTLFNTGFAALIVLGVVYNSARISLSERARDLASLRVLGFRRGEVSFVLLGELALLVLLAIPIGIPAGIGLSWVVTQAYSSSADSHASLYTIPFAMNPATVAEGVLVVAAAAAVTAVLIRLRTDRLDLMRALKTRE
jgi:putative ABC transport system permease protein